MLYTKDSIEFIEQSIEGVKFDNSIQTILLRYITDFYNTTPRMRLSSVPERFLNV